MAVCSCYALSLGGKVAHLRRPVLSATLRRSPPMCVTPVPRAARPRVLGSLSVAGSRGRAGRFKVTADRRMCRLVSAAAGNLVRQREGEASSPCNEGHGLNAAGPDAYWGTALLRVLARATRAFVSGIFLNIVCELLAWWARTEFPTKAVLMFFIGGFYATRESLCLLIYNALFEGLLKQSIPPLYKHIAQSHGTAVAMVQLAVSDPQRRLQGQLEKIVTSAYISDPDAQHVILEDTTDLLLRNQASLMDPAMAGHQQLTVVTLLVAAKSLEAVPQQITPLSIADMLGRLPLVNKKSTISCQVLWTPRDKNTKYTSDDLARDYPKMKALRT